LKPVYFATEVTKSVIIETGLHCYRSNKNSKYRNDSLHCYRSNKNSKYRNDSLHYNKTQILNIETVLQCYRSNKKCNFWNWFTLLQM